MTGARLEVEQLTVRRGTRPVLSEVSFTVSAGQIVAILGPNGAGKTTLMDTVVGRISPSHGHVRIAGRRVDQHIRWCRAQIGYADQELAVFPTMTVWENIWGWAGVVGLPGRSRSVAAEAALTAMLLEPLRSRQVMDLSGGERRRVHCAMAMVADPPVLLLDEPTVGVDLETRRALLAHVRALAARGTAICYSTHYLPEIELLDADVVLLRQGQVLTQGAVRDLLGEYANPVIELRLQDEHTIRVSSDDPVRDVPRLIERIRLDGKRLLSLEVRGPSLDDVFDRVVGMPEVAGGR